MSATSDEPQAAPADRVDATHGRGPVGADADELLPDASTRSRTSDRRGECRGADRGPPLAGRPRRRRRAEPQPAREGGTLFERMSNIARGAAKAQVEDEARTARGCAPAPATRSTSRASSTGRTTSELAPPAVQSGEDAFHPFAKPADRRFAPKVIAPAAGDLFTERMTISAGLRRGFLLAATGLLLTGTAARGQEMDAPDAARARPIAAGRDRPADGRHRPGRRAIRGLVTLANNPRSIEALIGAGRASAAMGDGEAALGFFARADEIDAGQCAGEGRHGARAGADGARRPGLAFVRPGDGARRARGARSPATAASPIDLIGRSAARPAGLPAGLRRRSDAEIERRLALSLAISGQRDAALRVLDPQLAPPRPGRLADPGLRARFDRRRARRGGHGRADDARRAGDGRPSSSGSTL